MECKANSLRDHLSYLSGHFLRLLIILSHSIKFWLYISLSSLFMTNTMLLSSIILLFFFGRNPTLWKSKWNVQLPFEYSLSHCNKKWTYRHQFLYNIAWNCLSSSWTLPPPPPTRFPFVPFGDDIKSGK